MADSSRLDEFYLSDVLQESRLVTGELDGLRPRQAAAGLHALVLQGGQTSGKDSLS